jgi:3-oxoacyl-[acyl-carrier protein] reductase
MLHAIGFRAEQGVPLSDLALKDFAYPIATRTTCQFLAARAVARHMAKYRRGVI